MGGNRNGWAIMGAEMGQIVQFEMTRCPNHLLFARSKNGHT